jgi:hypothetical protein
MEAVKNGRNIAKASGLRRMRHSPASSMITNAVKPNSPKSNSTDSHMALADILGPPSA